MNHKCVCVGGGGGSWLPQKPLRANIRRKPHILKTSKVDARDRDAIQFCSIHKCVDLMIRVNPVPCHDEHSFRAITTLILVFSKNIVAQRLCTPVRKNRDDELHSLFKCEIRIPSEVSREFIFQTLIGKIFVRKWSERSLSENYRKNMWKQIFVCFQIYTKSIVLGHKIEFFHNPFQYFL